MSFQALPYIILLAFLFGSTLIASRFSVGQLAPLSYVSVRLLIAGVSFLAVYVLSSKRRFPTGRVLWRHATVLGVLGTAFPMSAIVSSLQYQSSGLTAVLLTTNPALTIVLAHFLLPEEKLTLRKGAGALVALAGAVLLVLLGETGLPNVEEANPRGYLLVMAAMLFASATTIYARRYMRTLDTIDVSSVRMLVTALVIIPLTYLFVGFDFANVTPAGYTALIYASLIGTFAGTLLAFYNIQRFGATASAVSGYLIPLIAALGGLLLLDEEVTVGMVASMAIIIIGVVLLNQRPQRVDSEVHSIAP